jgi:predicted dehydrogenase
MAAVGLGIVGYGIMGERMLRATLDHDAGEIRIAGVWDSAADSLARLASDFPSVPRLDSADAVVEAADCLYVASPPLTHLEHARRALARGRAVFLEKPLSVDVVHARRFVSEVEAEGGRAAVNFPFASSPAVDQLRQWEAQGLVGTPERLTIEVAFAAWPRPWQQDAASWLARRAEGGFTREVVSHFLFLAGRLVGPLALRSATIDRPAGEASETAIQAELTAGELPVLVNGRVGETEAADHNLWVLEGAAGRIRLRDWSIAERRDAEGRWHEAEGAMANEKMRPLVLQRQLDKVARMTRGEPHDLATIGEALAVQEVVEAILDS